GGRGAAPLAGRPVPARVAPAAAPLLLGGGLEAARVHPALPAPPGSAHGPGGRAPNRGGAGRGLVGGSPSGVARKPRPRGAARGYPGLPALPPRGAGIGARRPLLPLVRDRGPGL